MADLYCLKCRAHKTVSETEKGINKKGRPYITAKCPTCGTKMFKFVKKD